MEQETVDNQVAIIHRSIEIFRSAPDILRANQERSAKAVAVGENIIAQWLTAWQIEDDDQRMAALAAADERSNKYLANCSTALTQEKEACAAIKQMMDEFKKLFTAAENQIDKAKADSVPAKVQLNRNQYAKEADRIKEEKRIAAEKAAAKAKEEIEAKAQLTNNYTSQYYTFLAKRKQAITDTFNKITLDDFDTKSANLQALSFSFSNFQHEGPFTAMRIAYLSADEIKQIAAVVVGENQEQLSANYLAELNLLKEELIEKLSSKKAELLEAKRLADEAEAARIAAEEAEKKRQAAIAKANAAEKERLEAEAAEMRRKDAERQEELRRQQEKAEADRKEREAAEAKRLADEAEAAKAKAEQEAEIKKQGDQTMVMFEQEAAMAGTTTGPETRTGYDIVVLHQAGYVQIFQLWFENEGKNLPVDKIGNTKLDQMKAWCEKHAHKTGTKIESKFLKYETSYKAVTRKAK